ncbi:MAG: hypothetical protein AABY22_25680, partial [Nanoarchaeota archaeon]
KLFSSNKNLAIECLKIPPEKMNRGYAGRVGRSVKKCGWELKKRTYGDRSYYYIPPPENHITWDEEPEVPAQDRR